MRIKTLSLWEPWATLVLLGHKRWETRSWPAPAWLVNRRIAVHAADRFDREAWECRIERVLQNHGIAPREVAARAGRNRGCVLCTARLAACWKMTPALIAEQTGLELALGGWEAGRWAWELADVRPLDPPVVCAGNRGLWWWDAPEGIS